MCSASRRSSHEDRNARRRGREPSTRRRGCEAATVVCKPPGGNRSHEPLIQCGTDRPRPWAMPRRSALDGPRRPPPRCELRPALRPMRANPRDGGRWNATADTARRREPERHTAGTNASRARRCAHDNGHDRHHRGARCRYHAEPARALGREPVLRIAVNAAAKREGSPMSPKPSAQSSRSSGSRRTGSASGTRGSTPTRCGRFRCSPRALRQRRRGLHRVVGMGLHEPLPRRIGCLAGAASSSCTCSGTSSVSGGIGSAGSAPIPNVSPWSLRRFRQIACADTQKGCGRNGWRGGKHGNGHDGCVRIPPPIRRRGLSLPWPAPKTRHAPSPGAGGERERRSR